MSIADNKQLVRDFFQAVEHRDRAAVDAILADDGVFWIIGTLPQSGDKTKAQFMASIQQLWDVMAGPVTVELQIVTAEEDRVSVVGQGRMVTHGGIPYCNTYHVLGTIRDGRIVGWREYFDTQLVVRAFSGA